MPGNAPPSEINAPSMLTSSEASAPNGSASSPLEPADASKAVRPVDIMADAIPETADAQLGGEEGEDVLPVAPNPAPLSEVCADVHGRVEKLLTATEVDEVTRRTQQQVRESKDIMSKALDDYG
jgi:hypothetical protein